ncbi:MAG: stage II sporulation protein P [Clostridia bacterium]|nr:stage II sporulation protein P [Clostridia bacterium]MDD4386377.1 stage II sporulation protein P [Clostridia bacterium]
MRITTVFFKRNIKKMTNTISNWFVNIAYLTYICILLISFDFFILHINISTNIIKLASDFRISEDNEFNIANFKNIFPVLDSTSYIIKEKLRNEVISVANENNSEFQLIDNIVVEDAVATFSNKRQLNIAINDSPDIERISIDSMRILNYSTLKGLNYQDLYNKTITLTKKSDKILLYNTHTSESYNNSEKYKFDYTGTYRTTDANFNMITVTKELDENLKDKNINAIQDTTPHDYGTYTSSYARSKITVKNSITSNGNFGISIDLHRDASGDLAFAPKVNIKGINVAQCMFVIGVGTDKSRNPYYLDNLSLAIQIQLLADKIYPGLFRPMLIRNSVYNQDLNRYSLLIEVGATGNTLDEAYYTTRCISNLLDIIYKK